MKKLVLFFAVAFAMSFAACTPKAGNEVSDVDTTASVVDTTVLVADTTVLVADTTLAE